MSIPNRNNNNMLAGVFCLNTPVTDKGCYWFISYNRFWQNKYSYDKYTE